MSFTYYDLAYYGTLLLVLVGYAFSFRSYRVGELGSFFLFRNASVVYFSIFSILLGKFVYEGTILSSAQFNAHLYYLMFYYAVVLLATAALFNLVPMPNVSIEGPRLNILPLLLALAIKGALLAIETTPMQELLLNGFAAAHIKQFEWHQPGHDSFVALTYGFLSPVLCILFIVYFRLLRSWPLRLLLLALIFETSGFYFSKSGLITPLVALLVLSGVRFRYLSIGVLLGVIAVFSVRLGTTDLLSGKFLEAVAERLVDETGYANPQLKLYDAHHPPLGYESRYYLGFNTLFDIEPAVDASREAYREETGKFGATSSGHAAVSLYAFWGNAFYLVLPILLAFIFYVDRLIVSRLATYYALVAYIFITFKTVNFLTVDIQRFISFQTLIDLTFLFSVLAVWLVGRMLRLRAFSAPMSLYGSNGLAGAARMTDGGLVQLTTVHPRCDTRILYRQVHALLQCERWPLTLLVADGQGSGLLDVAGSPVRVLDIGKSRGGRAGRVFVGTWRAFAQARRLGFRVIHFHDPELIVAGLMLKCLNRTVIYDVHEDVPRQLLHKHWLPRPLRRPVSWAMSALEWFGALFFDAIVCATPGIAARFPAAKTVVVQNFPILAELVAPRRMAYRERSNAFVYIGAIAEIRGAREMVSAIGRLDARSDARLELAGSHVPAALEAQLQALPGWARVTYHGWASRAQVATLLGQARAGLVVLHPTQNYPDAYPVKMFEYMAAGLPVIASNFPLWRDIVDGAGCGLVVDPTDPAAIAAAMRWILEHPAEAEAMGQRGARAVEHTYNWPREAEKLIGLYARLIHDGAAR